MFSLKSLNQPLTPKGILKIAAVVLLGAVLFFGVRAFFGWFNSRPPTPASIKRATRSYLKKQTLQKNFQADFDLKLKETVITMQTNAFKLRQQINLLQTNIANLRNESQGLRRELAVLQDQASSLKHQARNQEEDVTDKTRRVTMREQEFAAAQTNVMRYETNVVSKGTNVPTTVQERMNNLQAAVAKAETNFFLAQTNLATARGALESKRAAFDAKQKEVLSKGATLRNKQTEVAARQTELADKQKELNKLQNDIANKEQLLTRQYAVYAQEVRKKVNESGSYQSIYLLVGQQLWLADRLLEGTEPEQKRNALTLAMEASQHAGQAAENHWLAARICEAYLWPNLELTDAKGTRVTAPEYLLQACGAAFQRAEETDNVIKNYELTLKHTTNEFRADAARYQLGYALEQANRFEEAIKCYRAVHQNTNYIRYAEQRLAITQRKAQAAPSSKKTR